jgi:hypothetical protein
LRIVKIEKTLCICGVLCARSRFSYEQVKISAGVNGSRVGMAGSSEALLIVEALAEVTSHPDDNISAITFNFWHHLSHALTNRCGLIWIHDFFPR